MKSAATRFTQSFLTGSLRGLLRGLMRAWVLVVPLVLALSVIRLGQLAYFWPAGYNVPTSDITSVVLQGFRFDLKVSAIAGFLLLLVLPWVSGKTQGRIATGLAGATWRVYRYTPDEAGPDTRGVEQASVTGGDLQPVLPPLTWEFWEQQ